MLTPAQIEERQQDHDRMRENERIAGGEICAECGAGLRTPWNPQLNDNPPVCIRDKTHQGHVRLDPELDRLYRMRQGEIDRGKDTNAVDTEIQQLQIKQATRKGRRTMPDETKLAEYKQTGLITQESAIDIIRTTPGWEKAPANVVKRAAMTCASYHFFPGIHIFLIAFGQGTTKETWVTVFGIKAKRLLASRRKAYKYTDGPRIADDEEAKAHFKSEYDDELLYAVCKGEGLDGSAAEGWGWWKKTDTPYGVDKGNSKANMAEIRAESRFLDRLCPGEMPTGFDVVDESFVSAPSNTTIREVVPRTGEIIEGEVVPQPEPDLGDQPPLSLEEEVVETSDLTPQAPPKPQPTKGQQESRMMAKDPTTFTPKTQADLVGGAAYYWKMKSDEVATKLGGKLPTTQEEIVDAWQVLIGEKVKGGKDG